MSSRLVFGCGAALMGGRAVRLLDRAFENGVNHYDIGTDAYYKGSERAMAPFMKANREEIWVTSKAFLRNGMGLEEDLTYSVEMAKEDAVFWTRLMEASLKDLDTDYVDSYYIGSVGNPNAMRSEELYSAFSKAKEAGKVGHFGFSSHRNTGECLEAAIETGWYDQAMIAVTPAGWYSWEAKDLLAGTPHMNKLSPLFDRARESGIGLIGMKAGRHLAPAGALGKGDVTAYDAAYDEKFLKASLTPFQRSYAFVLEHGMDVVNADMQNLEHFEANAMAARTSHEHFA